MNTILKQMIKALIISFLLMIIFSLIGNIFYYFDIFSCNTMKYYEMLTSMFSCFIGGFILGSYVNNKGYLYGLKLSLIINIVFIILGFILKNIHLINIIYYLIITICITFGSMLGILKKNS